MTWREFCLKRHGFLRQQKEKISHTRTLAYMIYLSIPEKNQKQSIDKWWSLEGNKSNNKAEQKAILTEAWKIAIEQAKKKKLNEQR